MRHMPARGSAHHPPRKSQPHGGDFPKLFFHLESSHHAKTVKFPKRQRMFEHLEPRNLLAGNVTAESQLQRSDDYWATIAPTS